MFLFLLPQRFFSRTVICSDCIAERLLTTRLKLQHKTSMSRIVFFVGGLGLQCPVRGAEAASDFDLNRQRSRVCNFNLPCSYLIPTGNIAPVVKDVVFRFEIHQLRLNLNQPCRPEIQLDLLIHRNVFDARAADIRQIALFIGMAVYLNVPVRNRRLAQIVLVIVCELNESDCLIAPALFIVFV